ncbi:ATP-binding protein [Microbacterium sp. NPDC012755]|uniref:ATP-binding protein n=1 Tax=Microbacterium sp. NPDC012755 TaxID=3364184 RepID=UPI00368FE38E
MAGNLDGDRALLAELCRQPVETEWLEFKENKAHPDDIGEYVSALANSAILAGRAHAYMVWGVRDSDHLVVGTKFVPESMRVGNEELISWLTRMLEPQVMFRFRTVDTGAGITAVILEIDAARDRPVRFSGTEYVRVGTTKKKLAAHPELERELWRRFQREVFESGVALGRVREDQIFEHIDYVSYFDLLETPLPATRSVALEYLERDGIIARDTMGWGITNLGAVLFAKRITDIPAVARKQVRVVRYVGKSRVRAERSHDGVKGYATGFEGLIEYITSLLPREERIGPAFRSEEGVYPELALRELVANMLIHQDFSITGAGPMVEIFDDRVEFTNPGAPLIDFRRFVDLPPRSRNESLASMMRRARIAEERGTGWDKIAAEVERAALPAPRIDVAERSTKAVMFAPKAFSSLSKSERTEVLYLHSALRFVSGEATTNSSVRERFGISPANSSQASRLLGEAVTSGLLVLEDPDVGAKARRYLPFWAKR